LDVVLRYCSVANGPVLRHQVAIFGHVPISCKEDSLSFFYHAPDNGRPSNADIRKAAPVAGLYWRMVDAMFAGEQLAPVEDDPGWRIAAMRRREQRLKELNSMAGANLPPKPTVGEVVRDVVAEVVAAIAPVRTSALDSAKARLTAQLAAGPKPATELAALAKQDGVAGRTLERARQKLGLKPRRTNGRSFWLLREHDSGK
jgi:hypothetical protein